MTRTLWKKVVGDLLVNKTRTILVVLSIAVGVFAIGAVVGSHLVFSRDMQEGFNAASPANITIFSDPFDEDVVAAIRKIRGVETADGRRTVPVRVQAGSDDWKPLNLTVIPDYDDIRVNKLIRLSGTLPPPERGVLLERSSLKTFPAKVGDTIMVEAPDGKKRTLKVAGIVHDVSQIPSFFSGTLNGYITFDTLEALGEARELDSMFVRTLPADKEKLTALGRTVWDKLEKGGRKVYWTTVLPLGEHPLQPAFQALLFLLSALGVMSLLLSGFLLVNTITSILTQQMRQIGIMKTVGGTTRQIFSVYIVTVLCYSLLALFLAVPLGALGAYGLTFFQAELANIITKGFYFSPEVIVIQAAVAITVPFLASLYPLWRGVRVSVREAISSYGLGGGGTGKTGQAIDRRVDDIVARLKGVSRPLLLSLRNTFRRKGRLALTLVTLTLAGAIFIAVFSVSRSLTLTTDDLFKYFNYDVGMVFTRIQRAEKMEQEALQVPGVVAAESWGYANGRMMKNARDENDSVQTFFYGLNANTRMVQPQVVRGRWLLPEDENALVVNTDVLKKFGSVNIGDHIIIKVEGRKTEWVVVGVVKSVMAGPTVYSNFPYFGKALQEAGRAGSVQVITERHDIAYQKSIARQMEIHMKKAGLRVSFLQTTEELKEMITSQFNVLVVFLVAMAGLLALVGALGLAGTMSINVVERTREIGVMRAIGASDGDIFRIILAEGVLIGFISWLLGLILALPISKFMSDKVGNLFIEAPLVYEFSIGGALFWLAVLIIVSAAATWLPARNATRVSVRESLSYE